MDDLTIRLTGDATGAPMRVTVFHDPNGELRVSSLSCQPTPEDCNENRTVVVVIDGRTVVGMAAWYPQMGGYVGKCLVETSGPDSCFDCYVWHDGEFPFAGESDPERPPAVLHHCSADQFRVFADKVEQYQSVGGSEALRAKDSD